MHLTGKILAWLLIPLILVGMVFTAKLIDIRNKWTAKLEGSKKDYAEVAPKVAEAQFALEKATANWHIATEAWGNYFEKNVATNVINPNGDLDVTIGGQYVKEGQWLYGFELRPEGSIYRGDFVVSAVRQNNSLLQPNWRVRPGDTEGWQPGNWRWRVMIPSSYSNRFDELQQALLRQDELLSDRQQALVIHQELIAAAQEQLKLREAELVGGPELPREEALEAEYRDGLVATIEDVTEQRNAELIAGDRLRRMVRDLNAQIQSTRTENKELVEKLPQPSTEVSQKP